MGGVSAFALIFRLILIPNFFFLQVMIAGYRVIFPAAGDGKVA